jgi:acyl-CoA reductase-like NAD-dependent aldehyde dehydrogenase
MGPAQDLFDHLGPQDVLAFTGGAHTAGLLRTHPNLLASGVRLNVEADSLNAVVVGPDLAEGSELWDLALRDAVIELTQKAGQKCTATRRILVPEASSPPCATPSPSASPTSPPRPATPPARPSRWARCRPPSSSPTPAPASPACRSTPDRPRRPAPPRLPRRPRRQGLLPRADPARGDPRPTDPKASLHHVEVFGPVATLIPYDGKLAGAAAIVGFGGGSLVTTVYSDDREFTARAIAELGPHLGRLVLADEKSAAGAFSPGCVFPQANHGGPGRAGNGAELGGRLGLELYMQRLAVQAGASQLARLSTKPPAT